MNWHTPQCPEVTGTPYGKDQLRKQSNRQRSDKWRANNPDKIKEIIQRRKETGSADAWRWANPKRNLLKGAKARAKRDGRVFDLGLADITIPEMCPVLGMPLVFHKGRHQADSPTLDRINNDKGYVKGNVRVISFRANSLKKDAAVEELEAVVQYMRREALDNL